MKLRLPENPEILIVRLSALGDVLCALPVATALRRHFPEGRIAWLVEDPSADILHHHPDVDRVFVLPRRRIRNGWKRPWTLPGALFDVWCRMRECRATGFDLVLDLQGNSKSGVFTGLSRGRIRVGHDSRYRKEFLNALFTSCKVHPVPEGEATRHRVERDLGMVRALGLPAVFEVTPLTIPENTEIQAERFLAGIDGTGPLVVIHPGTSVFGAYKQWDPLHFARLADRIILEKSARVALSWGPGEEPLIRTICDGMAEKATAFPHPAGLLFPAAVFSRASLVVGSDSGPLHLAALMGARTLTLFGPKDPKIYRPMGENAEVIFKNVPCSPCKLRKCDHVTCMQAIKVEDVLARAIQML